MTAPQLLILCHKMTQENEYTSTIPAQVLGGSWFGVRVLLLNMDLWRIEEASICHLVCNSCLPEVFWRTFVKQTSRYYVILLVKIQGVLLLRMDLWRTPGASLLLDIVWRSTTLIFDELLWWKKAIIRAPRRQNLENLHLRNIPVLQGSRMKITSLLTPDIQYLGMTWCGKSFETIIGPSGSPEEDLEHGS